MSRKTKDWDWTIKPNAVTGNYSFEAAHLSVLMDIRDELQRLNTLLHCHNAVAIPTILRGISTKLTKPKKRKPAAKRQVKP